MFTYFALHNCLCIVRKVQPNTHLLERSTLLCGIPIEGFDQVGLLRILPEEHERLIQMICVVLRRLCAFKLELLFDL